MNNVRDILNELGQKGAAWQSQHKANRLLIELRLLISDEEWWQIKIAHSHYELREGADEFYTVINSLIEKYRQL